MQSQESAVENVSDVDLDPARVILNGVKDLPGTLTAEMLHGVYARAQRSVQDDTARELS